LECHLKATPQKAFIQGQIDEIKKSMEDVYKIEKRTGKTAMFIASETCVDVGRQELRVRELMLIELEHLLRWMADIHKNCLQKLLLEQI
jgi:hypothetical protein